MSKRGARTLLQRPASASKVPRVEDRDPSPSSPSSDSESAMLVTQDGGSSPHRPHSHHSTKPFDFVHPYEAHCCYKTLDVSREASAAEIRRAYMKNAKLSHPDKGGSTCSFQRIVLAFETLSDTLLRARYDVDLRISDSSDGLDWPGPFNAAIHTSQDHTLESDASFMLQMDGFAQCKMFLSMAPDKWDDWLGRLPLASVKAIFDQLLHGMWEDANQLAGNITESICGGMQFVIMKTEKSALVQMTICRGFKILSPMTHHLATLTIYHAASTAVKNRFSEMLAAHPCEDVGVLLQRAVADTQRHDVSIPWSFLVQRQNSSRVQLFSITTHDLSFAIHARARAIREMPDSALQRLAEELQITCKASRDADAQRVRGLQDKLRVLVSAVWKTRCVHRKISKKTRVNACENRALELSWFHDLACGLGIHESRWSGLFQELSNSPTVRQGVQLVFLRALGDHDAFGATLARNAMLTEQLMQRDGASCLDAVRAVANEAHISDVHNLFLFTGEWKASCGGATYMVTVRGSAGKLMNSTICETFKIIPPGEGYETFTIELVSGVWQCRQVLPQQVVWECSAGGCVMRSVWSNQEKSGRCLPFE